MIATNYSEVRNNLKTYCDKATKDYETIIITRKNNENVSSGFKNVLKFFNY